MIIGVNDNNSATHKQSGYTVIETMIFLVISGVILATSLLFFKGRQQRVQFTQGTREIEAGLKTVLNEVSSGYYPNKGDFNCTAGSEGPVLDFDVSSEQGSNENCIFLGKILKFNSDGYTAYTTIGLRKNGPTLSSSLEASKPAISENITESYRLPWGIRITKIVSVKDLSKSNRSAVGVLSSVGNFTPSEDGASFDIASGSQTASLLPIGNSLSDSIEVFETNVKNMKDSDRRPDKVFICLESAGGDRQAAIVLGGDNKQLNTELFIDSNFSECEDA